jgi:hypothetical protein
MMVIVVDAILEARRRPGGLNTPDETFADQDSQGVVHGLQRDRTDLASDDLGNGVRRDVRLPRDRPKHRESLRGDLNAALPEQIARVADHDRTE